MDGGILICPAAGLQPIVAPENHFTLRPDEEPASDGGGALGGLLKRIRRGK
jgi:hypothetical protein